MEACQATMLILGFVDIAQVAQNGHQKWRKTATQLTSPSASE